MYRLLRFPFLSAVVAGIGLVLAVALSAWFAWRDVRADLHAAAQRAVQNADRLIERTVSDLHKLDALRRQPCDPTVVRMLQDAVYGSLTQIREIGLIRDERLYCTSMGAPPVEIPIAKRFTKPGTRLDLAPNAVVANNTSFFIYVSSQAGTAVNALFNPQVLAEFERDYAFVGFGRLTLELAPVGDSSAGDAVRPPRGLIYAWGLDEGADFFLSERVMSTHSGIVGTAHTRSVAWWHSFASIFPSIGLVIGLMVLAALLWARGWLADGNVQRARYMGAMQRKEFEVHYQPIVAADSGQMVGMEALMRWQHPHRGLLRAAQFSDMFEINSLSMPLTRYVLDRVRADIDTFPRGVSLWVTVNIAAGLLENDAVLNDLAQQVVSVGGNRVRLEITERAPLDGDAEVTLHEMRARGVRVGMDDLGTGYANLSQLQRMPFDFIKIDGMLVRGIETIDGVSPVVVSLIELARKIGAEVVVEGVETKVQADALIKAGATHLQGYFFGAAMPLRETLKLSSS